MLINRKTGLAVALIALTAMGLSACKTDSDTGGGQTAQAYTGPGSNAGVQPPRKTPVDDGILHVWPQDVADRVFFDTDKTAIKPEGRELLGKWVVFLTTHPNDQLMIEGHSDERGTREYNLALGERRANAIKEYLQLNGIQAARIKTVSYGKERPATTGSNEEAYAQNRRAVGVLQ